MCLLVGLYLPIIVRNDDDHLALDWIQIPVPVDDLCTILCHWLVAIHMMLDDVGQVVHERDLAYGHDR